MIVATLVLAAGAGMFALGIVEPEMYAVGLIVIVVALIGLAVRSWDVLSWWRRVRR